MLRLARSRLPRAAGRLPFRAQRFTTVFAGAGSGGSTAIGCWVAAAQRTAPTQAAQMTTATGQATLASTAVMPTSFL
jgi:hypothetical protein